MKVFVTGGMGFIGSAIVAELQARGHELTLLARNPDKVKAFQSMPGISIVKGAVSDAQTIAAALPGHEALVHNALLRSKTPVEWVDTDLRSSIVLFDLAAKAGLQEIVYTSSNAAFGDFLPRMDEEQKPKPVIFYGATKAATEAYLLAFGRETKVRCNVIRPGFTFGNPVVPGARVEGDLRFKDIVRKAVAGDDIVLGKHEGFQFIWHADLAKIYSAVLGSGKNREVYYGLGERFFTWETVARTAVELAGSASQIILEDRGASAEPRLFDLGKIKRDFGLSFDSTERIGGHLKYLIELERLDRELSVSAKS